MRALVRLGMTLMLALVVWPPEARAQDDRPAPPSAEVRKDAARKFQDGTRAFDAGDFRRAGEAFEAAYRLAPHEDPLWNAARAWHRAGELARAANLYAHYLERAPPNARERGSANAALLQLAPGLARIEVQLGAGVEDPSVDGASLDGTSVYVVPGTHIIRARDAQGDIETQKTVVAGEVVSVVLSPPARSAEGEVREVRAGPAASAPTRGVSEPEPEPRRGWSPAVALASGGVTLVLGGLTTWSGLATLSTLDTFETTPSREGLETGRSEQARTNVLLGVTVGAAAITAVIALFFTDWGSSARAGAGANGIAARKGS